MSGAAWIWLIIIFLLTWLVPGFLFFHRPKTAVDRSKDEVWAGVPYEHLKFKKKSEIIIITVIIVGTTWLIWFAEGAGLLVWK